MTFAFVFPGQGSQSPGMLGDFAGRDTAVADTFAEASSVLGYDLWDVVLNPTDSELNRTEVTQPALLTAGFALWRTWCDHGGKSPEYLAGHSLGEYTALVCAGSLRFGDAVALVRDRGTYMQEAVPGGTGAMAAILGLDGKRVEELCGLAGERGIVTAANYNSPEQTVIAGHSEAVEETMAMARQEGAKRAILLPVSVPSHCALMHPAAERLAVRLSGLVIEDAGIPVIRNIDAVAERKAEEIRAALISQLYRPVQWVETQRRFVSFGCSEIVECGPGKVLTGLIKRTEKEIRTWNLSDYDSYSQALKGVQHEQPL